MMLRCGISQENQFAFVVNLTCIYGFSSTYDDQRQKANLSPGKWSDLKIKTEITKKRKRQKANATF